MVMVQDVLKVEMVDRAKKRADEEGHKVAKFQRHYKNEEAILKSGRLAEYSNLRYARELAEGKYHEMLDLNAGMRVHHYLNRAGILGRKPVILCTTQKGVNQFVREDKEQKMYLLSVPFWSEELFRLIDTYFTHTAHTL